MTASNEAITLTRPLRPHRAEGLPPRRHGLPTRHHPRGHLGVYDRHERADGVAEEATAILAVLSTWGQHGDASASRHRPPSHPHPSRMTADRMSAHDDEPVVIRMPFAVACANWRVTLAVLTDIHADTLLEGRMIVYASRMTRALAAVREGLRPLMLPEDALSNVVPLCACAGCPVSAGRPCSPGPRPGPPTPRRRPAPVHLRQEHRGAGGHAQRQWPRGLRAGEVDGTDAATLRREAHLLSRCLPPDVPIYPDD